MKGMLKILSRYVFSAAGVALFLLVVNFLVLAVWVVQSSQFSFRNYSISQLAEGLTKTDGYYSLSKSMQEIVDKDFQWVMLLNNAGNVIWSQNLPDDVPLAYTVPEVAGFTRWYLNDYPVYVWRHQEGLFVIGSAKGSKWKASLELPEEIMDNTLAWIPAILILNGVVAILLALLLGLRLFHSLKPIAKGIKDMADNHPVDLSTRGLLGDLAAGINKTSAQLSIQEANLNKRDSARTIWVAGISHDIRTPLSIVMGYASQLEDDPELSESKREQAGIIRRQSERIKTLVNNLNLASKLEYDMQPLSKKGFLMAVLLRKVVAEFINSGLSEKYSFDIAINEKAQSTLVFGDEELIYRAVTNLITNSIQHNSDGCQIKLALEKNLATCTLVLSDNGSGFSQDILENLSNPTNKEKLQNHGLGLTIVRQIIMAHEGTLSYHNHPDGGCSITICLPTVL